MSASALPRFSTDGSPPFGGMIAAFDRAVEAMSSMKSEEIDSLCTMVEKWGDALFECRPDWFIPLFGYPIGHQALKRLKDEVFDRIVAKADDNAFMTLCLSLRSSFSPNPSPDQCKAIKSTIAVVHQIGTKKLAKAITHYLHPDRAEELAELQTDFPIHHAFNRPLYKQYSVPPTARPLLFPTIDTKQFNPQCDWFLHLLSQYSPVISRTDYNTTLQNIIKEHSDPDSSTLLKPLSIPDTFIHNQLFNTYDEYLHTTLPQVMSQLRTRPSPSSTITCVNSHSPLFSYFPNPHPILPVPTSPAAFSRLQQQSKQFNSHFVHAFILSPILFQQHPPSLYQSLNLLHFMEQFDPFFSSTHPLPLSTHFRMVSAQYRTSLLTNDFPHLTVHLTTPLTTATTTSTQSAPNLSNNTALGAASTTTPNLSLLTTPTTFTNPYFPIAFSFLLPFINFECTHQRTNLFSTDLFQFIFVNNPPLIPLLLHLLQISPNFSIGPYLSKMISSNKLPKQLTIPGDLARRALDPNKDDGLVGFMTAFVTCSYNAYLLGNSTLHQDLYHHVLSTNDSRRTSKFLSRTAFNLLLCPLTHLTNLHTIQQHILLTLHAGFLHYVPPYDHDKPYAASNEDEVVSATRFYQTMALTRTFFFNYLLTMTNLTSYFPPSQHLQARILLQLNPSWDSTNAKLFPPNPITSLQSSPTSTFHHIAQSIQLSFPQVTALLYDDRGKIHAIRFAPPSATTSTPSDTPARSNDVTAMSRNARKKQARKLKKKLAKLTADQAAINAAETPNVITHVFHDSPTQDEVIVAKFGPHTTPATSGPCWLNPSPFEPNLSLKYQQWIDSDANAVEMYDPRTGHVQAHLISLFKQSHRSEKAKVEAKLRHVLLTCDLLRLLPTPSQALKRKVPPTSTKSSQVHPSQPQLPSVASYPFPTPVANSTSTPDLRPTATSHQITSTMIPTLTAPSSSSSTHLASTEPSGQSTLSDWALEMLILCALNISSPPFATYTRIKTEDSATAIPPNYSPFQTHSQPHLTIPFFNSPSTHSLRIQRAASSLLDPLWLSHNLLIMMSNTSPKRRDSSTTTDLRETLSSSSLSIILSIFDTMASLANPDDSFQYLHAPNSKDTVTLEVPGAPSKSGSEAKPVKEEVE